MFCFFSSSPRFWFTLRSGARPPRWAHQFLWPGADQRRGCQPTPYQSWRTRRWAWFGRPGCSCETQTAIWTLACWSTFTAGWPYFQQHRTRGFHGDDGGCWCLPWWTSRHAPPGPAAAAWINAAGWDGWRDGSTKSGSCHDGCPEGQHWTAAARPDGGAGDEWLTKNGLPWECGHG